MATNTMPPSIANSQPQHVSTVGAQTGASASMNAGIPTGFAALPIDLKLETMYQTILIQNDLTNQRMAAFEAKMSEVTTMIHGQETRLSDLEKNMTRAYVEIDSVRGLISARNADNSDSQQSAEIIISSLPCETSLSDADIITRIFTQIEAANYLPEILSASRRFPQPRATQNEQNEPAPDAPNTFSILLRCKSVRIRNEIMRCKISFGDLPASSIFPDLQATLEKKLYLNEWLPYQTYKLLRSTRVKARACNYERVWVRNGAIFVKKDANADRIPITSEADLQKMI